MLSLPGYSINQKISETVDCLIYTGFRKKGNHPVHFKLLKELYPSLHLISRFLHEHDLLKTLHGEGTVKVEALEKYKNGFILILEKGGPSLEHYLKDNPRLQLSEALSIAIALVECISTIHQFNIIHKNINLTNVLFDKETNTVRLIDFSIASTLPKEDFEFISISKIEGSLSYMSPEQTGRMNRGIDYRSDYYAIGVVLYRLFTSVLPFQSEDPLALIHAHIAKTPEAPHVLNPDIPKPVSDIIMKLLAKTAEERYQSTYGILVDLRECLNKVHKTGLVDEFALATKDASSRFKIPEKLYGREAEVAFLLEAFTKASQGRCALILVAGYSGIGKSSLIQEVRKPLGGRRFCYFISGKFDQLKRNIPYAPFIQSLDGLINQLLTQDAQSIQAWKIKITESLGTNTAVMTEVLPSLVKIVGEQPPLEELNPNALQNRFIFVFQKFIQLLATENCPLVMFLDDLQWVDLPSLRLLDSLLHSEVKHVLISGAYRDNEVSAAHPLMLTLERFKKENISFQTLILNPLKKEHIQHLLADTLFSNFNELGPLAELCETKTLGNPFFLSQFLKALHDEDLIHFDKVYGTWHWLYDKIKARQSTDNVVELVINNMGKLSQKTREVLTYASCLGNRFNLQLLSMLCLSPPDETAKMLEESLQEQFIVPLDERYRFISDHPTANATYQFSHDKVQQAAYSLISEQEKKTLHLRIGRYFLASYSQEHQEDALFDILNQLNLGANLIHQASEKLELAQLNFRAGQKAKISAAYGVALFYFKQGIALLPEQAWNSDYELTLKLYSSAAEAAYLSNEFTESEHLGNLVLANSHSLYDKVSIYEINIYTSVAKNRPLQAIKIALNILHQLGVNFSKKRNLLHVLSSVLYSKWLLVGKNEQRLITLPLMADTHQLHVCRILSSALAPMYYAAPELFPLCTLKLFNLSIKYGYNQGTPSCYVTYGIILNARNDLDGSYKFGHYALKLIEYYQATESEAKVTCLVYAFIVHWKEPFRNSMAPLLMAHLRGIQTGDLEYSSYAAYFYVDISLYAGINLVILAQDTKKFYEVYANQYKNVVVFNSLSLHAQITDNLLGLSDDPCIIVGNWYDEQVMLQEAIDKNHRYEVFAFYMFKQMLNYLFYQYETANEAALKAFDYISSATASAPLKPFTFYYSLNLLALCERATTGLQKKFLKIVAKNQKQLKLWAKHGEANCLHKYVMVEAELARVKGDGIKAQDYYDKAIHLADKYEFIHEKALANELAGKFYAQIGKEMVSKGYIIEAYYNYHKWGCAAKLQHLEKEYPYLIPQQLLLSDSNNLTSNSASDNLDLKTIVKASQIIAKEIILPDLLKSLMKFLIENAGAEKGYLLLEHKGEWLIEASVLHEQIHVLQSLPPDNLVPNAVIQYVIHAKEVVSLDSRMQDNSFIADPYIIHNQPKSVLALPLLSQGVLSAILYLENNLTADAFTKERVGLLNMLSTQIIISIANARLYHDVTHDFLTGLANRNLLYQHFDFCAARALREERSIAIIFLDLDCLKTVNDTLGHEVGDKLLVHVADLIKKCLRKDSLAVRLGGDEFVILLDGIKERLEVEALVERLYANFKKPVQLLSQTLTISSSMGVSFYPAHALDIDNLLKFADVALYKAKESGKNNCQYFSTY